MELDHLFHSARAAWGEKEQREFLDVYLGEKPTLSEETPNSSKGFIAGWTASKKAVAKSNETMPEK